MPGIDRAGWAGLFGPAKANRESVTIQYKKVDFTAFQMDMV